MNIIFNIIIITLIIKIIINYLPFRGSIKARAPGASTGGTVARHVVDHGINDHTVIMMTIIYDYHNCDMIMMIR